MTASPQCPKCGATMGEHALTASDGTPLGFAGGGESGSLISLVCPDCGYAELRAAESAGAGDFSPDFGVSATITGMDIDDADVSRQVQQLQDLLESRGILGTAEPRAAGIGSLIVIALSAAFMSAGIVWLWQSSGPVMEAGGFVASGGPYVIAHPAEDWIWLPTLGATFMVWATMVNFFVARHFNRPSLILVFWTALFGTMAIPFFRYGFNAPGGGRSWTWIFLGVMFALFALPTLLLLLMPDSWRGFRGAWGWANLLGVIAGVVGGFWVWSVVA